MLIGLQVCPGHVKEQRLQGHYDDCGDEYAPQPQITQASGEYRSKQRAGKARRAQDQAEPPVDKAFLSKDERGDQRGKDVQNLRQRHREQPSLTSSDILQR
jgi:hypothetical protein